MTMKKRDMIYYIPFHNETIIKEMMSEIKDIFSVP
tara:strand:- start:116 stop:220 length:105 start_codon:yes stop_codon:yes gene_type:complete